MKTKTKSEKETKSGINSSKDSQMMRQLFEDQLKDIYWAEQELTRFMPKIVNEVTSVELKNTLQEHMKITQNQVKRLEKVFQLFGSRAEGKKCEGLSGLISEAEEIIESADKGQIRDAFIIGAVQKVEHYETASYGTLRAIASIMGEFEIASLLGETLREEKEADEMLTEVAESVVNIEASRESGDLESEDEEEDEDDEEMEEDEEEYEGNQGRSGPRSKSRR